MKTTIISIVLAVAIIGGAIWIAGDSRSSEAASTVNVTEEGEKQIIDVTAKGGYAPKVTAAKAGVPTVLRITTNGTFDCSAGLTIPSLGYRKFLEPSGVAEIEVPPQKAGASLKGVCVMGMYSFEIRFS